MIITGLVSCEKGEDFKANTFPGFSGTGTEATWVVFRHNLTDQSYLTGVLPTLTPPTTLFKFDSTYKANQQKEVSPVSYRIYKNGEIAVIVKNAQNQNVWQKQNSLKWELVNDQMYVYRNNGASWVLVCIGFQDEEKLLIKFKKSFFGDTSADKEKFVMEVYYTIFK